MNLLPKEAADRLRIHDKTLARWRQTGEGPRYLKYGRKVLYPLTEIEAWEQKRLRTNTEGEK